MVYSDMSPIGLMGFASATLLFNLQTARIVDPDDLNVAAGIVLGGFAQLLCGILEFLRQGTQFAAVAFSSYGLFWIAYVVGTHVMEGGSYMAEACYLYFWTVFTLSMTVITFVPGTPIVSRITFCLATVLFGTLALNNNLRHFGYEGYALQVFGGWVGILAACCAFYDGLGSMINHAHNRQLLPNPPTKARRSRKLDNVLDGEVVEEVQMEYKPKRM
ncbi:GPR1/FUN34/yaaH family protein [Kipferlia bialata]|uniref:GPR1/FUN34/yaaH family protein n=1 Tax=Kipferlia bialata TaxID=797122 RepID=A0A391NQ70_9EUKA|nr:GPR1/FUN34/yaaH family protein [Kipferlia bialata]|eukprot:g10869.t1